jgi:hypothetical protein
VKETVLNLLYKLHVLFFKVSTSFQFHTQFLLLLFKLSSFTQASFPRSQYRLQWTYIDIFLYRHVQSKYVNKSLLLN